MKCALRPLRWKKKQQNKQKILSPQGASFGTKVSSSFLFNCHQRPTVSLKNTGNSTVCSAHSRALLNTLLLKSNKVFFSNFLWKTPAFEGGVGIQQILFYCGFLAHLTLAFEGELGKFIWWCIALAFEGEFVLEIYLVMVYLTPCTKQFKPFKWWGVEI